MPVHPDVVAFAKVLRDFRSRAFKSLREFCAKCGENPITVYKWEEGFAQAPPRSKAEFLATILTLTEGTSEYRSFIALAQKARDAYTPSELPKEELFKKLPGAFRGLRVDEDPEDVIQESWNIAREAHRPEQREP